MCQKCRGEYEGFLRKSIEFHKSYDLLDGDGYWPAVRRDFELYCKAAGKKVVRLKADAAQAHKKMRKALNATEPKLIRVLVKTWNAQKAALKYSELEAAIKLGNLTPATLATWKQQYQQMIIDDFKPQYEAMSKSAWSVLENDPNHINFKSSMPTVAANLRIVLDKREAQLLQYWTQTQAEAVNTAIKYFTVDVPINPKEAARYIRPMIGLTPRQAQSVLSRRALLEKDGLKGEQLEKAVARYANHVERGRAENIARTEMATAYYQSEVEYFNTAKEEGVIETVVQTWLTAQDERVCEICGELDGMSAPLNEPFVLSDGTEIEGNPAHNSCRCTMTYDVVLPK